MSSDLETLSSERVVRLLVVAFLFILLVCPAQRVVAMRMDDGSQAPTAVVLVLDTSLSMIGRGAPSVVFPEAIGFCIETVGKLEVGDAVTLITFATDVREEFTVEIEAQADLDDVRRRILDLDAEGVKTYMSGALRAAFLKAETLSARYSDERVQVYVITDGKNDPPDGVPPDDYELRSVTAPYQGRAWFVHVLQLGLLDETETELERVLDESFPGPPPEPKPDPPSLPDPGTRWWIWILVALGSLGLLGLTVLSLRRRRGTGPRGGLTLDGILSAWDSNDDELKVMDRVSLSGMSSPVTIGTKPLRLPGDKARGQIEARPGEFGKDIVLVCEPGSRVRANGLDCHEVTLTPGTEFSLDEFRLLFEVASSTDSEG